MAKPGFDFVVHERNSKGKLVRVSPYKLVIENGTQRFERPVGSGQWFDAGGNPLVQAAPAQVIEPVPEQKKAK